MQKQFKNEGSDAAQRSELVPQHKRIAMGVPLDGKGGLGATQKPASKPAK